MSLTIKFYQHDLILLSNGGILLPKNGSLIISDINLNLELNTQQLKAAKPCHNKVTDLSLIQQIARSYQITQLIIVGNLIHSQFSKMHKDIINRIPCKKRILVKGSVERAHLIEELFDVYDAYEIDGLQLVYQLNREPQTPTIVGNIHPYVNLILNDARQRYRCFYQNNGQLILPTFGVNKGGRDLSPGIADQVYVIAGKGILPLKTEKP